MNHHYQDITDKLGQPRWWDEAAVPRYTAFSTEEVANIYAGEVALAEIACQGCGHLFPVAFSLSAIQQFRGGGRALAETIERGELSYGDPPNYGCCAAGPTMTSDMIRVIEFWRRERSGDWVRVPELEIACGSELEPSL